VDSFAELAGFYDLDYPDTSDHLFLTRLVSAIGPRHLLEIPCGSGRNIGPLLAAAAGHVTFADIAETMVDQVRRRIPESARGRARAVVGDLRSCCELGTFDLVVCPREAFQLLDRSAAARALESMAAGITDDGLIVVDLFAFTDAAAALSDAPPDYFSPDELNDWVVDWTRRDADRDLTVTRHRRQLRTADGVRFQMRYELRNSTDAAPRTAQLEFDMTNYSHAEFCQLAGRSGLDVLTTFAGYTADSAATSLRTVFFLGVDRGQETAKRLERIRHEVGADRGISESHRPDAR
jgi:SAM-dependent methyltransferase